MLNIPIQTDGSDPDNPKQIVVTTQVLTLALAVGMTLFAAVAIYLNSAQRPGVAPSGGAAVVPGTAATASPLLVWVALGAWPVLAIAAVAVPKAMEKSAASGWRDGSRSTPMALHQAFASGVITRGALLEGPGLLGVVAFLLEGHPLALAAPAASLVLMLAFFPTMARHAGFVRRVTGQAGGASPQPGR